MLFLATKGKRIVRDIYLHYGTFEAPSFFWLAQCHLFFKVLRSSHHLQEKLFKPSLLSPYPTFSMYILLLQIIKEMEASIGAEWPSRVQTHTPPAQDQRLFVSSSAWVSSYTFLCVDHPNPLLVVENEIHTHTRLNNQWRILPYAPLHFACEPSKSNRIISSFGFFVFLFLCFLFFWRNPKVDNIESKRKSKIFVVVIVVALWSLKYFISWSCPTVYAIHVGFVWNPRVLCNRIGWGMPDLSHLCWDTSKAWEALSTQTLATVAHIVQYSQNGKAEWKRKIHSRDQGHQHSWLFGSGWFMRLLFPTSHCLVMTLPMGRTIGDTQKIWQCKWHGMDTDWSERMLFHSSGWNKAKEANCCARYFTYYVLSTGMSGVPPEARLWWLSRQQEDGGTQGQWLFTERHRNITHQVQACWCSAADYKPWK